MDSAFIRRRGRIFLAIAALLGPVFAVGCSVPARHISVTDVFGNPLEGIPVSLAYYLGDTVQPVIEGKPVSAQPEIYFHLTDKQGLVTLESDTRAGIRPIRHTKVSVNDDVYPPGTPANRRYPEHAVARANRGYDFKELELKRSEKEIDVVLALVIPNYRDCLDISDPERRGECLVYGIFHGAIEEENEKLCSLYRSADVQEALNRTRRLNYPTLFEPHGAEFECLLFVGGLLKGREDICTEFEGLPVARRKHPYVQSCRMILDPMEYAASGSNALPFRADPEAFFCEMERDPNPPHRYRYKNSLPHGYLNKVIHLYRETHCRKNRGESPGETRKP